MSDTEMSRSILDGIGLLETEPANEEPDQGVEEELLQSSSEGEDKDIQSPNQKVKKGFVKGEGLRLLRTNSSEETFVESIRIQITPSSERLPKLPYRKNTLGSQIL